MTICVGWRDAEHVYLVADSLLTYSGGLVGSPLRPSATFREPSEPSKDRPSVEIGCKVFDLGFGVVAGYSGATNPAIGTLLAIRNGLRERGSLTPVVETVPLDGARGSFTILVGRGDKKETLLYQLRSDGSRKDLYEDRVPTVLGSLPEPGKDFVRRASLMTYGLVGPDGLPGFTPAPDDVLASAVTGLQALGRRVDLIRDQAGGAFFGMRSSQGEVHPQRDILYVVFTKSDLGSSGSLEAALVGVWGDALIAWPLGGNPAVYASDLSDRTNEEIAMSVRDRLSAEREPEFICLIERQVGALICIDCHGRRPSKYITLDYQGPQMNLTLRPEVMTYVNRIPDATPTLPLEVPYFFLVEPT
jgi:hypothetical protein